jgi:hypothetical protein
MTVLAGVWIFYCVFSLMEERQELLKQLEKWQKSRVSGIAGHSKTWILSHRGAAVLCSYLGFFQSFIFARPTGHHKGVNSWANPLDPLENNL